MHILIVDDDVDSRLLLTHILCGAAFPDTRAVGSADEAMAYLEAGTPVPDLILMDVLLPQGSGIEICRLVKSRDAFRDIPILMVTAQTNERDLEAAFAAGAMDYITKPFKKVELLARIRSALALKQEMDCRKRREEQLLEISRQLQEAYADLQRISCQDDLTGIANRRHFEEVFQNEWRRALREQMPISFIMIDIDRFKQFNDTYGHPAGDACLRRVAGTLAKHVGRPGDMVGRYGGEEFAIFLCGTDARGAGIVAENLRRSVASIRLKEIPEAAQQQVTISLGVASTVPKPGMSLKFLVSEADQALYQAKRLGRNRVEFNVLEPHC